MDGSVFAVIFGVSVLIVALIESIQDTIKAYRRKQDERRGEEWFREWKKSHPEYR